MKSQLEVPKVRYGLAGYACLCVVILGSCFPIRKYCYELFIVTHLLGIAFIGVIAVHTPYAMRYFISGLICYGLNLIAVWFVKSYVAVARFEVLPGGCIKTSIRLASPLDKHYVGQHINLCIPAISPFQWHPFTITSVQPKKSEHQNSIQVCICTRGNFTRQLYKKADPTHETRVFVSGPFGNRNIEAARVLESYSSVVIACGGAGVTFGMRLLREITETLLTSNEEDDRASLFNHWKTENIYFYWSVRRPLELEWFNEELEQLNHLFETHDDFPSLHVKFYCTLHDTLQSQNRPERPVAVPDSNANTISTVHIDESAMNGMILDDDNVITEEMKEGNYNRNLPRKKIETIQGQRLNSKPILSVDNDIVCGPIGFNAAFKNAVALQKTSTVHLHCEEFAY
ncbi:MAG: hypothetical protein EXX96DRAFT_490298 [Benjaminiella poitrasii]|nr:MAG: hypothetical protein EXX96DRAFT_490298 [Benjaminiella poitrasii]